MITNNKFIKYLSEVYVMPIPVITSKLILYVKNINNNIVNIVIKNAIKPLFNDFI